MIYIFYGKEDFLLEQYLKKMVAQFSAGDEASAQMNIERLEGGNLSLNDFVAALSVMPFLTDKRLLIVQGLLARFEPRAGASGDDESKSKAKAGRGKKGAAKSGRDALVEGFAEACRNISPSTDLILIEPRDLSERNPLLKALRDLDRKQVESREFKPLNGDDQVSNWIQQEVSARGGRIETEAALLLATAIGSNLRRLDQEIEKALTYTNGRPITPADVQALVSEARGADIFAMVDAVGARDRAQALSMLHDLLKEGAAPLYLLAMITRQFRMLMQVKELSGAGIGPEAIRAKTGIHPFVLKKMEPQSRRFSLKQLEDTYARLLDTDAAIKTGRSEPVLALDLLVAELTK